MSGTGYINNADMEPLRIALVAPPYFDVPPQAYGGTEAVVADLADALVARGHRVTLIGAGTPGTAADFIPVWDDIQSDRLGQPYPEIMHTLKTRRAVKDLAANHGLDIVHEHTMAGPLNAAVYAGLGLPTLVTVHGPLDDDLLPFYRALGGDAGLIAISDRQRELAPDLNWVGRVHNALRLEDWPFKREKQDYALFLGRYAPYKGAHLALEAAHRAGVPLVLAGKCDEPGEKAYFEECVAPLLTDADTVFGEADATSKRRLLANARCVLFPVQWEEPFGMVMIEAMACGTPVVALRGGAVPEVIDDGVSGIICDHPDELPAAIEASSGIDPAACRHRVASNFTVAQLGSGYEQIYYEVASGRPARRTASWLRRSTAVPPSRPIVAPATRSTASA